MLHGYAIIIKRNGQDGSKYPLMSREITIGTSPGCQILINTPFVSIEHCSLSVKDDERVYVKNLSARPTIVNESELCGEAPLNHGDVLEIGGRLLRWEYLPHSKHFPSHAVSPKCAANKSENKSPEESESSSTPTLRTPKSALKSNSLAKSNTPISGHRVNKLITGRKSLQVGKLLFSPVGSNRRKSDAIRKLNANDLLQIASVTNATAFKSSPMARQDTPVKRVSPISRSAKRGMSINATKLVPIVELPKSCKIAVVSSVDVETSCTPGKKLSEDERKSAYDTPPEVKTPGGSPKSQRGFLMPLTPSNALVDASFTTPPEVKTPTDSPTNSQSPVHRSPGMRSPPKTPSHSFISEKSLIRTPTGAMNNVIFKTPRDGHVFDTPSAAKTKSKSQGELKTPTSVQKTPKSVHASPRIRKTPAKSPSSTSTTSSSPKVRKTPAKSPSAHNTVKASPRLRKTPAKSPSSTSTTSSSPKVRKTPAKSPSVDKVKASPRLRSTPAKSPSDSVTISSSPRVRKSLAKSPGTFEALSPSQSLNGSQPTAIRRVQKTPAKSPTSSHRRSKTTAIPPMDSTNIPKSSIGLLKPASLGPILLDTDSEIAGVSDLKRTRLPLKGQIKQNIARIFSNKKYPGKRNAVYLKTKLLKKSIKVSNRKPKVMQKASVVDVQPSTSSGSSVHGSILTELPLPNSPLSGRRSSKRISPTKEAVRPDFTELSPTALGLAPRLNPSTPVFKKRSTVSTPRSVSTMMSLSASKSHARLSVVFSPGTKENDSYRTPNISQDVFVSPLTESAESFLFTPSGSNSKILKNMRENARSKPNSDGKASATGSPFNDFSNVQGVGKLLRTPKQQKSPKNDLRFVSGLKSMLKTPMASKSLKPKSPENDLTDVRGVKELFASTPKNDLRNVVSIRRLLKSPVTKTRKTPATIRKKEKSPSNDLTDVQGVKTLFTSPRVQKSPRNDLSSIPSIRVLMKTPPLKKTKMAVKPQKSPKNDLSNVSGVRNIFVLPAKQNSPDFTGLNDVFVSPPKTPKDSPVQKRVTRLAAGTPVGRTRAAAGTPAASTPPVRATRARKITAPTEEADKTPIKVQKLTLPVDALESSVPARRSKATSAKVATPAKPRVRRKAGSPDQADSSPPPQVESKVTQPKRSRAATINSDSINDSTHERITTRRGRPPAKEPSPKKRKSEDHSPEVQLKTRAGRKAAATSSKVVPEVPVETSPSPKKRTRAAAAKKSADGKSRATRSAATKPAATPSPKLTRSRAAVTRKLHDMQER